ncbi:MAG: hypothetical protein ACTHN5_06050 [Phycisphaerae bacterium]
MTIPHSVSNLNRNFPHRLRNARPRNIPNRFESLEQRTLLSAWGVQLISRVQPPSDGGPAPFGGDQISNLVIDHAGNIFAWEGNLILEMPAGATSWTVAGDLSTLPEPEGMSFAGHSNLQIDDAGNIFGIRWNADPGYIERFELPHGCSTIQLLSRDGPDAAIPLDLIYGPRPPVQVGDRQFAPTETGVAVTGPGGNSTILPYDPAEGRALPYFWAWTVDKQGDFFASVDVTPQNGPASQEIIEVPAGSDNVVTLAKLDRSLGDGPMSLAIDDSGSIYGVAQTIWMSVPEIPNLPPSVPTLFNVLPLSAQDKLVLDAPAVVDSNGHLSVTVKAIAPDGTIDTGITSKVSLQISAGPGGELSGTLTGNMVDGVVTFTDVTLPSWGTIATNYLGSWAQAAKYVLAANADGFATGFSAEIDVTLPADVPPFLPANGVMHKTIFDGPGGGGQDPAPVEPPPVTSDPVTPAPAAAEPGGTPSARNMGIPAPSTGIAVIAVPQPHLLLASPDDISTTIPIPTLPESFAQSPVVAPAAPVADPAVFNRGYMLDADNASSEGVPPQNSPGSANEAQPNPPTTPQQPPATGSPHTTPVSIAPNAPLAPASAVAHRTTTPAAPSTVTLPLQAAHANCPAPQQPTLQKMGIGVWTLLAATALGLARRCKVEPTPSSAKKLSPK